MTSRGVGFPILRPERRLADVLDESIVATRMSVFIGTKSSSLLQLESLEDVLSGSHPTTLSSRRCDTG